MTTIESIMREYNCSWTEARRILMSKAPSNPRRPTQYQYTELPKACICTECGHVLDKPTKHCRYIKCPKCGAPMWRKR